MSRRWNASLTDRIAAGMEPDLALFYNFNEPVMCSLPVHHPPCTRVCTALPSVQRPLFWVCCSCLSTPFAIICHV